MSQAKKNKDQAETLQQLSEALKKMPDAFNRYPDLLAVLKLKENYTENVASLMEKQTSVLKQKILDQQKQTQRLVNNAKHHEFITSRLFDITYELTACEKIDDIFDVLYQDSLQAFDINFLSIRIARDFPRQSPKKQLAEINAEFAQNPDYQHVLERINQGNSLCSDRFPDTVIELFFDNHADEVKSIAFVPLMKPHTSKCFGILGLGSIDQTKFSNKLSGTLHLDRLGTVAAIALDRVLKDS
ncbi:MAG: DUF484 family protein [Arenicella sp.]